ncbi:MAG: FAD-binding protein [Acetobacteraceae bacterium]|nr:FAD-binding protein [Acetobacteraceae bacterium]
MSVIYDAAVIGAGPSGLASATLLAEQGARTVLLDEQPGPGGQIYRATEDSSLAKLRILGADYARGAMLVRRLRASPAEYLPDSAVWNITPQKEIYFSRHRQSYRITANVLVLATGAMERPMPVPGWTLPGVMTAGALQILLKTAAIISRGVILVGTGPLLYLLAWQYVAAGAPALVILDTSRQADRMASLALLPRALRGAGWRYLLKGLRMFERLARAGVPIYRNVTDIRIEGVDRVESVQFRHGGKTIRLPAHTIGLHAGVIPVTHIANALGCAMEWDAAQYCLRPTLDAWGNTSTDNILIAGDGGFIGGARAAEHAGRLAALEGLYRLGRIDAATRDRLATQDMSDQRAHLAVRAFLDRRYAPSTEILRPADATIVCRCEEITAGQIRAAARQGAQGPNQAKAFLRAGMGPCQGRVCGPAVSELMAEIHGRPVAEIGTYRIRPPFKPITVGELATLDKDRLPA